MAKNRDNIRIYGDDASGVWVGDRGSQLPTDLGEPTNQTEIGWLSDDGIDLDRDVSSNNYNAYQGGALVRVKKSSVSDSFHFVALEETAETMGLFYAGVTPTIANGVETYEITNQTASDERAWVVDFVDGDWHKRLLVPSGEVTAYATISHKNSDMTMYDFTVTIYGNYTILRSDGTSTTGTAATPAA